MCTDSAASIFDERSYGAARPAATPDTSLMDVEMDSVTPPARPPVTEPVITDTQRSSALQEQVPAAVNARPWQEQALAPRPSGTVAGAEVDNSGGPKEEAKSEHSIGRLAINYFVGSHDGDGKSQSNLRRLLDRPDILLSYAQVIFNASLLAVFLYLLFCIVWTVQHDVSEKVREYEMEYLGDISACSAAYKSNRCGTDLQAPALAEACATWQRCASRDHKIVGRARVTAETFAEILNGFVDAVSWKTMAFTLIFLSIFVGAANSTLSLFRISAVNARHDQGTTTGPNPLAQPAPAISAHAAPPLPPHLYQAHSGAWDADVPVPRLRTRAVRDDDV